MDDDEDKVIPFDPKPNDVLCGTRCSRTSPGNVFYLRLLAKYKAQVKAKAPTTRRYQTIMDEILEIIIHQRQGRFLTPTDSSRQFCVVMNRTQIELKIKRALYNSRSRFLLANKPNSPPRDGKATNKLYCNRHDKNDLSTEEEFALAPTPSDVVYSNMWKKHPGNVHYWKRLKKYAPQLRATTSPTREEYDAMIDDILEYVLDQRGGRFLKPASDVNDNVWIELNRDEAKDKIDKSLHNHRGDFRRHTRTRVTLNPFRKERNYHAPEIATGQVTNGGDDDCESQGGSTDENSEDESSSTTATPLQHYGQTNFRRESNPVTVDETILFNPQPHDVVCCRRAKWYRHHPGNIFFTKLIKKNSPQLEKTTTPTKEQYDLMVDKVLQVVIDQRVGRFLRPTDTSETFCFHLSRNEAKKKVLKALYKCRSELRLRVARSTSKMKTDKQTKAQISDNDDDAENQRRLFTEESEGEDNEVSTTTSVTLPAAHDQSRDNKHHHDNHPDTAEWIIPLAPKPYDVVGSNRRKWAKEHPGNVLYLSLLKKFCSQLRKIQNPTRQHYHAMVHKILEAVVDDKQGRFLKFTDHSESFCKIMSRDHVQRKISQQLRKSHLNSKRKVRASRKTKTRTGGDNSDDDDSLSASTAATVSLPPPSHSCSSGNDSNNNQIRGYNNIQNQNTYGSSQEEATMRRWLNDNCLPQLVGDILLTVGARNIEDVALLVEAQPDLLRKELAVLDFLKLQRAVSSR